MQRNSRRNGAAWPGPAVDTGGVAAMLGGMRITLIHALKHSIVPIEAAFARLWPEARLMNLLDDSLSADLARCTGNLFARVGCEHVARAQYCDGYWGQVAQCPGGVANDHGQ